MSAWRCCGVGVGVCAQPQEFSVVEVHPGLGYLQSGFQAGAGIVGLAGRAEQPRENRVERGDPRPQVSSAHGFEEFGQGRDVGRQCSRFDVVGT